MANLEHLEILKQGVAVWNQWRKENPEIRPDLGKADLTNFDLYPLARGSVGVDFRAAILCEAKLPGNHLAFGCFDAADLRKADLRGSTLKGSLFRGADLRGAELQGSDLSCHIESIVNLPYRDGLYHFTDLTGANLGSADLSQSDIREVTIEGADFNQTILRDADVTDSTMGATVWIAVNLCEVRGLNSLRHSRPSVVDVRTLRLSHGRIPASFLRGCGFSDWEIEASKLYDPDMSEDQRVAITYEIVRLQGEQPIQVNPLFVSYSHADAAFLKEVEPKFDKKGIRYWRDVHNMKAGRMETQIDRAIRLNPTVLLVLSENSVESDWVEWEAARARKLEKELRRDVLCPVALDEAWKTCSWSGPLRRQIEDYHILDFSGWQDTATFERQFAKLLDGLKLFYKPRQS